MSWIYLDSQGGLCKKAFPTKHEKQDPIDVDVTNDTLAQIAPVSV